MRKLRKLYPESDIFFRSEPENPTVVYLIHLHTPYHHAKHLEDARARGRRQWQQTLESGPGKRNLMACGAGVGGVQEL